jgi:hypothetical protein
MMPRLTEAEADDLAVKALMAMAVDEYRDDLRARVLKLPGDGPTVHPYSQGYMTAVHDVLRLLDTQISGGTAPGPTP